jgi:hypothetical protein
LTKHQRWAEKRNKTLLALLVEALLLDCPILREDWTAGDATSGNKSASNLRVSNNSDDFFLPPAFFFRQNHPSDALYTKLTLNCPSSTEDFASLSKILLNAGEIPA